MCVFRVAFSILKIILQEFNTKDRNPEISGGIITSSTQLDSYEKLLHLKVFKPSRDELRTTVILNRIYHKDLLSDYIVSPVFGFNEKHSAYGN